MPNAFNTLKYEINEQVVVVRNGVIEDGGLLPFSRQMHMKYEAV